MVEFPSSADKRRTLSPSPSRFAGPSLSRKGLLDSYILCRRGLLSPQPSLSSRHSLPGSIALSARHDADKEISLLAAGEETEVAGHRNTLTPMDPGNKSRDDNGKIVGLLR